TCGYWKATSKVQASAIRPASHASALRALEGSSAAHRLPINGRARIRISDMSFREDHRRRSRARAAPMAGLALFGDPGMARHCGAAAATPARQRSRPGIPPEKYQILVRFARCNKTPFYRPVGQQAQTET